MVDRNIAPTLLYTVAQVQVSKV